MVSKDLSSPGLARTRIGGVGFVFSIRFEVMKLDVFVVDYFFIAFFTNKLQHVPPPQCFYSMRFFQLFGVFAEQLEDVLLQ